MYQGTSLLKPFQNGGYSKYLKNMSWTAFINKQTKQKLVKTYSFNILIFFVMDTRVLKMNIMFGQTHTTSIKILYTTFKILKSSKNSLNHQITAT